MRRHFLLNLAHRSAGKTTVPQARPHLLPVFMPPAPTLPAAGTPPAQPMSPGQAQTAQEGQSLRSRTMPEKPDRKSVV